ncbi:mitochondrion organization and biogenesis protein [Aspergillus heteromorphus CBS 117.55]|uniref:Required for respiratory growth protein 9, mitochondrial n=1 Tax=Aspergillus heteromorphus CBS 117.55 TaxID=1448321 RepID=A0A317VCD7_9EURO|nr:mitochondrion organization and biogenesis protein [Aspergillus heteromorphus CBS 117.55]PWY71665.1 mitochondrion organization and biogenesis protein [Aspergillus heteromorphus CBS 117.55]
MTNICTSSLKLSLPNLLRNALRSEFAADAHRGSTHRGLLITPLPSYNRGIQQRQFSSFLSAQISQSTCLSSAQDPSSTSPDVSSEPQSDITRKPPRGEKSTKAASNARGESADTKTKRGRPRSDARTFKTKRGDSSETKPVESKRTKKDSRGDRERPSKAERKPEKWEIQKHALEEKFQQGWNPPKKLSPDALEGIRHLHKTAPEKFTTPVLAEEFKVSPEAIRRILKSKWRPSAEETEDRRQRWEKRHDRIWGHMSELGLRPPRKRQQDLLDANRLLYAPKKKAPKEKEETY